MCKVIFVPNMVPKLHCFFTIYVLFTAYCSVCLFLQHPHIVISSEAPGITSRNFDRSDGGYSDIPITGSSNSPQLKNFQSSHSEPINPGHLGYKGGNLAIKSKIPDLKTSFRDGNQIVFPPHPSKISNTSSSLSKLIDSSLHKSCKYEDALVNFGGKCHSLLKQGPCSDKQWLLINENDVPYCALRPCQEGELLYNEKCVNISDESVCGVSEVLYIEFSGEVYCDCLPHYYVYDTKARKCFAENDQGSCPDGEFLDIDSNNNLMCLKNPCETDKQVYNPNNKSCYKKGYIGSCKEDKGDIIVYNEKDQTASCANTDNRNYIKTTTIRSCPFGSKTRSQKKCPEPFISRKHSSRSYRVPSQNESKHYPCRPGPCKKINDLLLRG